MGYVEAFDPDVLVQLAPEVPHYVQAIGLKMISARDIWTDERFKRRLEPQFGIGVFAVLHELFEKHFRYKAKYPIKVTVPTIPSQFNLFWTAVFGDYPDDIRTAVLETYGEALEIEPLDLQPDNVGDVMGGNVFFPRRIAQVGVTLNGASRVHDREVVFFMDATKVSDVVDYWNLRATGHAVIPLPKQRQVGRQLRKLVYDFLEQARRLRQSPHGDYFDTARIIKPRSSTIEEMEKHAKELIDEQSGGDPPNGAHFGLQPWHPRIWDERARDGEGLNPADTYSEEDYTADLNTEGEPSMTVVPVLPSFSGKHLYTGEALCANEITLNVYGEDNYYAGVFPKSNGKRFLSAIGGLASSEEWRVGRHGLVKLVHDSFRETRKIPEAETIFFAWLEDRGWSPQLSAPGLLAKQMFRKLKGGIAALKDAQLLGLFEHMNGGSVQKNGQPKKRNEIGNERDLPVAEVKNRLTGGRNSRQYDYLLELGVFALGARVQCPNCTRHFWLSLSAMQSSITCQLCLNTFPALGVVDTSTWCYKTTGPFSVPNYADGAYVVLFSLDFFAQLGSGSFRATAVPSFNATSPGRKELEADFAMFWQERDFMERRDGLLFGECKTYGQFEKKDIDRMRYLGASFPGAVLVFSTLRNKLEPREAAAIARIAKRGRKPWKEGRPINPVLILTGTELLGWSRPPYCWPDDVQKRFRHESMRRGIIEICDMTQQIYLGLPSSQQELHESHQKKRAKLLKRAVAVQPSQQVSTTGSIP